MPPDEFAMEGLKALQPAVDQAWDRKRRLGQYAVFWENGRVVFDGPDAPEEQPNVKSQMEPSQEPRQETDSYEKNALQMTCNLLAKHLCTEAQTR